MIEQLSLAPVPSTEQLSQAEVDARFDGIIQLLELNAELNQDLQADRIADLQRMRSELLADLLNNPTEAFLYEFTLLKRLYENRTLVETDSLGTTVSQFVTRDPARKKADLHFRDLQFQSGSVEQMVEVPGDDVGDEPFFVAVRDGELRLTARTYHRGEYRRTNIDPESPTGLRLLTKFFTHSITASDLVYNRTPDKASQADEQARRFLYTRLAENRR